MLDVEPLAVEVAGGIAHVRFTTRADGDMNADVVAPSTLAARHRAVVDLPWTWLTEVHGTHVVTVTEPGEWAGATADAAVTACPDAVLGIWVGDCAPVALVDPSGVVGAAHAGWRGLADGVLARTVVAMRELGAERISAVVGPCVHAECYEFGADDLAALEHEFGPPVRAMTTWGTPALDLPAAVELALASDGVSIMSVSMPCTACDARYWSHRARGEKGRHAMAVWVEADAAVVA